jgi:signal transduction histidine kinase
MTSGKNVMTEEKTLAELGSVAAGIAHDLNNQLILILNYLDVSDVAGARAAADRCSALTGSLLSWCRGETLLASPLNLNSFLLDFADSLHLPDGIILTLDCPETSPEIKADPLALNRILTNLVSNACHAMNNNGTIVIRALDATIEVTDAGPGIAPADAKHIFEPFFSTKGMGGTGLGLAIVRELMIRHGGSVIFRNESRKGATFVLRFRRPLN